MRSEAKAVALNGRFSGTLEPTGTQIVAFNLFDAIIRGERDVPIVVFADPRYPGVAAWRSVPLTTLVEVPFSHWRRSRAQLWEQLVLPRSADTAGCYLIHHPMTTSPRWRNGLRQLVTVHDLTFYSHPEWTGRAFRWWLSLVAVPAIKTADYVIAISDYVLADLRRTLGISSEKSARIYNGLTPLPAPAADAAPRSDGVQVVLAVNPWQPHKNLPRLIEAFTALRAGNSTLELHLAGRPQANYRSQPELAALLDAPGIRVLGYLSNQELADSYAGADVFCYPSLEEGFGLPILEAMAAGAPVVTSNASCLPEIAGGAAILVDPTSAADIAAGLKEALSESPAARAQRIDKGKHVAARFPWSESGKQYLQLYGRLA